MVDTTSELGPVWDRIRARLSGDLTRQQNAMLNLTRPLGLVEGVFNRAFRARVQPVELARRLAKEMESYKAVSVSRTYVPNEYIVFLAREDRRQFEGYEPALLDELAAHLLERDVDGTLIVACFDQRPEPR